ncbi:MAG: ATP-binding protein [Microcoleaceae cyanobacterium]
MTNPSKTLNYGDLEERQYYIDFTEVRGNNLIKQLKRTITWSDTKQTCQLFTGHIGCGKSTELLRLKSELEDEGFHVVFFASSKSLDMADVDISDILLAIAFQVSRSLEEAGIHLQPTRFQNFLQGATDLLNSRVTGFKLQPPKVAGIEMGEVGITEDADQYSLSLGIGEITTRAKDSRDVRSLLREYTEPRVSLILEAMNKDLLEPAQEQLQRQHKSGLVVIVDNLDRIDNRVRTPGRTTSEYLFVDRGEQLNQLKCHVVYTIPLVLKFSGELGRLTNRFGQDPYLLPMVRIQERDGRPCEAGVDRLRQMILIRAFPDSEPEKRLKLATVIFDQMETLDRLCMISGGHVRNLLVLLHSCLRQDEPPFSRTLIEEVINQRRNDLVNAISPQEWKLLYQVLQNKAVQGEDSYQDLIKSLFVFEYRDDNGSWFDVNPILLEARQLQQ